MENERLIGRVVSVESQHAMVELEKDLKSLHKSFYSGVYPIARINSYVVMPIGSVEIVGIVTRVSMREDSAEINTKAVITLPEALRLIRDTMLGTLRKKAEQKDGRDVFDFSFGISEFPALDNPVYFVLDNELDAIFDKSQTEPSPDSDDKTYYLPIGKSGIYKDYSVKVDPDSLFSRHLAVLGNTGSGKSCTIAQLLQTILRRPEVKKGKQAHFIIFDTNGEYKDAFPVKEFECLTIGKDGLKIPYWFMNLNDFQKLFRATPGVQEPVLSRAISIGKSLGIESKQSIAGGASIIEVASILYQSINNLMDDSVISPGGNREIHVRKNVLDQLQMFEDAVTTFPEYSKSLTDEEAKTLKEHLKNIKETVDKEKMGNVGYEKLTDKGKIIIKQEALLISEIIDKQLSRSDVLVNSYDVDAPAYFRLADLLGKHLKLAMQVESSDNRQGGRVKENCSTMILRINRLLRDERYRFLLDESFLQHSNSLATFIRYVLGRLENNYFVHEGTKEEKHPPYFDFLIGTKSESKNANVVIIDMSLLAPEILENVTALIGRLILEFSQRMDRVYEGQVRGKFPIVIVLEEAHNYIPQKFAEQEEGIAKQVFERIAREGRKYGISLVVSSQRPSELSETVLSQCNSFIVHRIQNPRDQEYIKNLVPSVSKELLDQLPILAQRTALVFGDCVRAPAQVIINEVNPRPRSHDPKFWDHWTGEEKFPDEHDEPNFEKVCAVWEGK